MFIVDQMSALTSFVTKTSKKFVKAKLENAELHANREVDRTKINEAKS